MKSTTVLGRGAMAAALLALFAAPAAHADGALIPGGTVGGQLYKAGTDNLFVKYIGKQAFYVNDLYFYLTIGGTNQFLFRNTSPTNTTVEVTSSSGLATGAEAIFSICANLDGSAAGTGCTTNNQYYSGPAGRNPDNRFHAVVWTREAYLAGCALMPDNCAPDVATAIAELTDPGYNLVVGFEDSFNYNIDNDFNDLVFAVRGATTVPEPVTMTLLATGLAGMGGAGLFRRRKHTV
jgi:hypothetical protein